MKHIAALAPTVVCSSRTNEERSAMSAEQDVVSGAVWDEFCDTLKRAGQQILRPEAASSPLDRAEGWRYLKRLLRIGLEMHLEFADPDFPGFFLPSHETGKIGAANPDRSDERRVGQEGVSPCTSRWS